MSSDVCPGLQAMCFMQAQALKPYSSPDIAPLLTMNQPVT